MLMHRWELSPTHPCCNISLPGLACLKTDPSCEKQERGLIWFNPSVTSTSISCTHPVDSPIHTTSHHLLCPTMLRSILPTLRATTLRATALPTTSVSAASLNRWRAYSAAAGLSRSDIQSRVLDVLKSFEKVDGGKVSLCGRNDSRMKGMARVGHENYGHG
jgi:hypothetical protein